MEVKTMKRTISILLAAGLLVTAMTGMAVAIEGGNSPLKELPHYFSVTGTVVSVEEYESGLSIKIEDADGNPAFLKTSDKAVFLFESGIKEGDIVTGWYLAAAPMITIWPPQFTVSVLVAGAPGEMRVVVDRFFEWEGQPEGMLLAQGGEFAFRVDENTEIVLANGDDFTDGYYIGRRIVVIFSTSTRSIPEIATAHKLIVLYEDPVFLPETVSPELLGPAVDPEIDASGWPIFVDDELINAPAAFQTSDGVVMVPLRVIAQALGFTVIWNDVDRSVTLDDLVMLTIGSGTYHINDADGSSSVSLPAPVLLNGSTFVPLRFFTSVLDLPGAFAFEGQIEIHSSGESMV